MKKNLLLFLGAGFSHDAGCPLQKNFFTYAYANSSLSEEVLRGISAAQILAKSFKKFSDEPTMEDAYCALDYVFYMKQNEYKLACLTRDGFKSSSQSGLTVFDARNFFLRGLEEIYGYKQAIKSYFNSDLYCTFFKTLLDVYNVAIMTINYDLVCESTINKIGKKAILYPVFDMEYSYGGVPLLKLHGSIDWKETPFDLPNIIPPTWSKHFERYSKYNYIWSQAEKAIYKSDRILFIGCSMPSTDPHIHYLLQYGLANKINDAQEKKIFVIKPHWTHKDCENYMYLKNKEYNVVDVISVEKDFKSFVESNYISCIE